MPKKRKMDFLCTTDGAPLVVRTWDCPIGGQHTPAPAGYVAWHEWAARMQKTYRAIRCAGCNRYAIWVPKVAA